MGLCIPAALFPDIEIISGDQELPLPAFDKTGGRSKRAIQMIPLLVGLGVATGAATGAAGLGTSLHFHRSLSQQMIDDLQAVSGTILDLQSQLDSLAAVVLQNRRGLDILTAEKGDLCLFLQEECCFYANNSGIIQDKIRRLQDDLEGRRRELQNDFFWTGLHGWLPYLLPILSPTLILLLMAAIGPCIISQVLQFLRNRVEAIQLMNVQVQYQ